jgi:hypothetical protein
VILTAVPVEETVTNPKLMGLVVNDPPIAVGKAIVLPPIGVYGLALVLVKDYLTSSAT